MQIHMAMGRFPHRGQMEKPSFRSLHSYEVHLPHEEEAILRDLLQGETDPQKPEHVRINRVFCTALRFYHTAIKEFKAGRLSIIPVSSSSKPEKAPYPTKQLTEKQHALPTIPPEDELDSKYKN